MNTNTARNIRGKNLLILFFAILILMLNMFLPIVSTKTDDPNQNQYFNLESMKKSDNEALESLSNDLNQVNILLSIIVIIGFLSFLGLILKLSEKTKKISNLFIMSGCVTVIASSISFLLSLFFLIKANRTENVSLVFIYINVLLLMVLFIITVFFTIGIIKSFITDYRNSKKDELKSEVSKRKQKEETEENKNRSAKKHIKFKLDDLENKRIRTIELAESNKTEIQADKKTYAQEDKESYEEKEIPEIDYKNEHNENEKQNEEIKPDIDPFPEGHKKVKEIESKQETKNLKLSDSFEKALESAIERKKSTTKQKPSATPTYNKEKKSISDSKNELKKEISKEIDANKKIISEKFNVKCPKCGSIFEAEKQPEGVTKIKCPRCGKEGVIK